MNGLEALDRIKVFLKAKNKLIYNTKGIAQIEKELKALEIIKKTAMKLVSLEDETTICVKGRYAIYDAELYGSVDLTQDEFDLLKEVLK